VLMVLSCYVHAQYMMEDCANGIDDDGDGLIDLNDPDCRCKGIKDTIFIPSSLIPNPSFENYTCCPWGLAQLNCSQNWIQASAATSDYYHTCGFRNDPMRGSPPQPLPAGNGYVGFLDLQNGRGQNVLYKEYVGACLNSSMLPGKEYTLSFWIGFGTRGNTYGPRVITTLGIFGTSACGNLPFGAGGWQCPTAYPGWFELTRVTASGTNRWVRVTVKLRPTRTVEAIVLGPQCTRSDGQYYFFLDDLILEESTKFDSIYLNVQGNPCIDSVSLSSPPTNIARIKYQWYLNGIAIVGATNKNYLIPKGQEGNYVLRASDGADCELSNIYTYKIDTIATYINQQICNGEKFYIGSNEFTSDGSYRVVLQSVYGCDSIVNLNLKVNTPGQGILDTTICENEFFDHLGVFYDSSGTYQLISKTAQGCDSFSTLNLRVIKTDSTDLHVSICQGHQFIINYDTLQLDGVYPIHYLSSKNCDSIVSLHLNVLANSAYTLDTAICKGQFIESANEIFDSTGLYTQNLKNAQGCDSLLTIQLRVKTSYFVNIDTSFCDGNTWEINNTILDKSGIYHFSMQSTEACDSNIQIQLNVLPVHNLTYTRTLCEGDSLFFGSNMYNKTGTYQLIQKNQFGCDSISSMHLTVHPVYNPVIDTAICDNKSIVIGNETYVQAGTYIQNLSSINSCDSILLINLTMQKSYLRNLTIAICEGEFYSMGNTNYNKTGFYTAGLKTYEGCDSTIQLNLVVNPVYNNKLDTVICFDGSVVIDGTQYFDSADFSLQYLTHSGCDSVIDVSIKKTIRPEVLVTKQDIRCFGESTGAIQLKVNGGFGPYRYNWNNGKTDPDLFQIATGTYIVSIFDNHNCKVEQQINISSPEQIKLNILTKNANCIDPSQGSIAIQAVSGGVPPYKYKIDGRTVSFASLLERTNIGSHQLTLEDANGCIIKQDFFIDASKRGDIDLQPDSLSVILGDSVWLDVFVQNIDSIVSIEWSGPGIITCTSCLSTSAFVNNFSSHFKVIIKDHNGCIYEEIIYIKSKQNYYVPNAFTPNGDNINDYFNIFTDRSIDNIEVLHIFDRWGNQVYEAKNFPPNGIEGAWNGEIGSQKAIPGVYVYLFLFKDKAGFSHKASGDLTLMR
jgi:gliding motility-associated-like protein